MYVLVLLRTYVRKTVQSQGVDDYAKDDGPSGADFYVVFAISLCAFESKESLKVCCFNSYHFEISCTPSEKPSEANLSI